VTRLTRAFGVAFASMATLVFVPGGAVPAHADPIGNCTTTTGTIIAVDFGHWGGPIVRGCGVGQPNGYSLLHAAGFNTAGDNHDGPGYICRIGNQAFAAGTQYPTPAQDACIVTPPSTAYWSYWYAPVGRSTWSYSSLGAQGAHPQPGEVDLWVFGGTDVGGSTGSGVPHVSPDSLRAHNAAPPGTPTTRAGAPPATAPAPGASVAPNANPNANLNPSPTNPATGPSGPSPTDPIDPGPTRPGTTLPDHGKLPPGPKPTVTSVPTRGASTSTTIAPRFVDALPAVHTNHSAGSFVPVLIGAGLVLALGGGAAGALRRRRQHE
jgi:hypothetical protein